MIAAMGIELGRNAHPDLALLIIGALLVLAGATLLRVMK